ncbi:hypothetical protein V6N11_025813 [Hibiscus sabdariffa]|uniref:Uncharacterized protein n=1 Tax=Hibiscus sabdariffa TaxID=183260 RepID=A0ABR2STS5_9ROSI
MVLDTLNAGNTRRWHFRFEAAWLIEESCESEVKHLWDCSVGFIPARLVELGVGLDASFARIKRDRRLMSKIHIRWPEWPWIISTTCSFLNRLRIGTECCKVLFLVLLLI